MFITRKLWEVVALPAIIYGTEVFEINKQCLTKLSKAEREVGRWALGGNRAVVIEAVYGDLGWLTLKWRIQERRLRYLGRL